MIHSMPRRTRPVQRPELHSGDRMSRAEFHELYEQMPDDFKAELVGGIVFVASPMKLPHARNHPFLSAVVTAYAGHTKGVEVCDNATILLGDEGEPQPDLCLRTLPEYGGQSKTSKEEYIVGGPEWVSEVAHSSRAIDLHLKKDQYQRHQVLEYLVMWFQDKLLCWFDLKADQELEADADGVYRMRTFPGLWIHGDALFANDYIALMKTLQAGLATEEHAAFVDKLARNHRARKKGGQDRKRIS